MGEGERERTEELQDADRILARGFVGGEEERRRGSTWRWPRRRATTGGGVAEQGSSALGSGARSGEAKSELARKG